MSIKIKDVIRLDISDSEYFGEKYFNYISNSRLRALNPAEGGSYSVFCNPSKGQDRDSFTLGTAVHKMLLEKDRYYLSEFTLPGKTVVTIFDTVYSNMQDLKLELDEAVQSAIIQHGYYNGNPGEKRLASLLQEGLPYLDYLNHNTEDENAIVLPSGMKKTVEQIIELFERDRDFVKMVRANEPGIYETHFETAFVCDVYTEKGIYPFKAKIDMWSLDFINKKVYLTDLKTTSQNLNNFMGSKHMEVKVDPDNMFPDFVSAFKDGSFQNYHYYRQMYVYASILKAYLMQEFIIDESWTMEINMVVVQTTYDIRYLTFPVNEEWISMGEIEFKYLLSILDQNGFKTFKENVDELDLDIEQICKPSDDDLLMSMLNV